MATVTEILIEIKANIEGMEFNEGSTVTADDVLEYCNKTMEQIAQKNEKAAERRARKKIETDALLKVVYSLLTDKPQTRDDIFEQIEDSTGKLTVCQVGSRLIDLTRYGKAVTEDVKIEGVKTPRKGYKLA